MVKYPKNLLCLRISTTIRIRRYGVVRLLGRFQIENDESNSNSAKKASDLFPELYDRLRAFARQRFDKTNSLFGTELVHEAYLKVAKQEDWDSKAHFFGAIRNAMKNVIVDHVRKKGRIKHGGEFKRIELDSGANADATDIFPQLIALSDALDEFEKHDERAAQVVTLRFFACMTEDEISEELKVSRRTIARDWSYAKAWLSREMGDLLE